MKQSKGVTEIEQAESTEALQAIGDAIRASGYTGFYEISPSWTYFWDEIAQMSTTKEGLFKQVPASDRDGEWQVIIDNPFSHDNVACYPQLSFLEGSYLYCYFFLNLKKNEYVRLQKIVTAVQTHGA